MNIKLFIIENAVGFIISLSTAILATVITNFIIQRRLDKRDKAKQKLLEIYCRYLKLEYRIQNFNSSDIQNLLFESRLIFDSNKKIAPAFARVDIGLSHAIRYQKAGSNISYNFNSEEYLEFILLLKNEIGGKNL